MKEEQDMQCAAESSGLDGFCIRIPIERVRHAMMLQVLEKAYVGQSEPLGLSFGELIRQMEREASRLLCLEIGGTTYPPAAVRFHLHDSSVVHRAELPEMFNLVPLAAEESQGFSLRVDPALAEDCPELWIAPCSSLGAATLLEPDEDGAYHPCPQAPNDLYVLYATVKGGDDELYKKYIWLVGFVDL